MIIGERVLLIDADHAVAQARHGQDTATARLRSRTIRSTNRQRERLGRAGRGTYGFGAQAFALEHVQERVTRR